MAGPPAPAGAAPRAWPLAGRHGAAGGAPLRCQAVLLGRVSASPAARACCTACALPPACPAHRRTLRCPPASPLPCAPGVRPAARRLCARPGRCARVRQPRGAAQGAGAGLVSSCFRRLIGLCGLCTASCAALSAAATRAVGHQPPPAPPLGAPTPALTPAPSTCPRRSSRTRRATSPSCSSTRVWATSTASGSRTLSWRGTRRTRPSRCRQARGLAAGLLRPVCEWGVRGVGCHPAGGVRAAQGHQDAGVPWHPGAPAVGWVGSPISVHEALLAGGAMRPTRPSRCRRRVRPGARVNVNRCARSHPPNGPVRCGARVLACRCCKGLGSDAPPPLPRLVQMAV